MRALQRFDLYRKALSWTSGGMCLACLGSTLTDGPDGLNVSDVSIQVLGVEVVLAKCELQELLASDVQPWMGTVKPLFLLSLLSF
jgi:hypothetical protein